MYDEPEPQGEVDGYEDAADDRVAEQFRREFMEAVSSRNFRRRQPKPPGVKGEEKIKGPKLGGSRSARAAMRAKQQEEKKGVRK